MFNRMKNMASWARRSGTQTLFWLAMLAVDIYIALIGGLWEAYLYAMVPFVIWTDVCRRAQMPFPVLAGRWNTRAAVCFLDGEDARQLRVATHFWRDHKEPTHNKLAALAARYGVTGGVFSLRGVVLYPDPVAPPVPCPFRIAIDVRGAGNFTLWTAGQAPPTTKPIQLGLIGLEDVLEALIGRHTRVPSRAGDVPGGPATS